GTSPMQLVAFEIGEDGLSVTGRRVLERAHSLWTEPLGAAVHGNTLYYVATGQWDRFEDGGVLKEGLEPRPTAIRAIRLGD
ncbi:MAG TPA: hypothetical protein VLA37_08330, partial [Sphingomonadaceae bacterium]|nr:hypothetical protein [Sphingomonadaceae bacterium]